MADRRPASIPQPLGMPDRMLSWEGCDNVRDLGGLPIDGGGHTRRGAVVRADELRALTATGWAALRAHGVERVVDLRGHDERALDGPPRHDVEVVHVPVLAAPGDPYWLDFHERVAHHDPVEEKAAIYLAFLDDRPSAFATAIAAVGEAGKGAVVVHCQEGKDRTGLVCAMLLRLAGVPIAVVADDYAESAVRLAAGRQAGTRTPGDAVERDRVRRMAATPAAAMRLVVERLEAAHGSVVAYLSAGGASAGTITAAARRLV